MSNFANSSMTILRLSYAFAIFGINIYAALATYLKALPPLTPPTTAGRVFLEALTATSFFTPVLAVTFLSVGSALLFQRTAPLGIVLLAPPMVIHILLSHFPDRNGVVGCNMGGHSCCSGLGAS